MLVFLVSSCIMFEFVQLISFVHLTKLWHGWFASKETNKQTEFIENHIGGFIFLIILIILYSLCLLATFFSGLIVWNIYLIAVPLIGIIMSTLRMPTIKKSLTIYRVFWLIDTCIIFTLWIFARMSLT